jgi:acyl-coenzyme A thioesterase PaaI-like protein
MDNDNKDSKKQKYLPDSEYPLSSTTSEVIKSLRSIISNINYLDPLYENIELSETVKKLERLINEAKSEIKLSHRTNGRYRNPISGILNPIAAPLLSPSTDDSIFYIRFNEAYQGVPTLVHGGVILSVLDDVIQKTAQKAGYLCLTADIKTVFKKKTPLNTNLIVKGEIVEIQDGKIIISSSLINGDIITATAVATMIPLKLDAIKGLSDPSK